MQHACAEVVALRTQLEQARTEAPKSGGKSNKHASVAATFNLYLGATGANAAGTELAYTTPVAVGASVDIYFPAGLLMTTADYLVGGSNTATALTIEIMGEIGVA